MIENLRILASYRDLLWLWSLREVRVRYKQSFLGMAWAIVQPLVLTLVFTVIFSRLIQVDTGNIPYPVFAYTALVPWTFFATAIAFGIPSLVNNMNLVTKIYFPREILPLASISAAFVDFGMAALVLVGLMIFYGFWPTVESLWIFPLLLLQLSLTVGVTLIGAAIIVFQRDMRFVIPLLTQVWMYATPIIYPVDLVPVKWQKFYFLNPMAGIVDGYRRALLEGLPPRMEAIAIGTVVTAVLLITGYYGFKRAEPVFADLI